MKRFTFSLDQRFVNEVFKPIRSKSQSLVVLMKCTKLMLVNRALSTSKEAGTLVLLVSKRSRIFLFSEEKYFSIAFPFFVQEENNNFLFSTNCTPDVDSKITSDVLAALTSLVHLESKGVFEFAEQFLDFEEGSPSFWPFFISLLLHEDGYVRYDYDPANAIDELHPLNHYDFFYSSSASCKLGLATKPSHDEMMEMMLPEMPCHFVNSCSG